MTKISSGKTFFNKKIAPVLWLAFFAILAIRSEAGEHDIMFRVVPLLMAVFGFFLMKKFAWDLVDEVYDCGDFLLIRNRGEEDRVALSNIMNVNASTNTGPPRITLRLVSPGKFGAEIAFSPVTDFTLNPFAKLKVAENWIFRVDQSRSRRAV